MKKPFIIDCQVLQTPAWHRGMGKYTWELLKSLSRSDGLSQDMLIVLNSNLGCEEAFIKMIKKELRTEKVYCLDLQLSQAGNNQKQAMLNNTKILDKFIMKNKINDSHFLVMSPLSDEIAPAFPEACVSKMSIVYDLIPFIFYERYIKRIDYNNYLSRYKLFFEADKLFSISDTVKSDLITMLGIPEHKIININGSFIDHKKTRLVKPSFIKKDEKFILMPTGEEIRKNNHNAVRAFELFRSSGHDDVKLVVTSFFTENTKEQLKLVSPGVVFSGNIPGNELQWLFDNAQCLLFPSEYEGLGMPVLEGVRSKIPIACSSIGAFREMSEDAFIFFDPKIVKDITIAISQAFEQNRQLSRHQSEQYSLILNKYTWEKSAKSFLRVFKEDTGNTYNRKKNIKPKIAIVTPDTEGYSAIGKVVSESHYALSEIFDITYYYDRGPNHRFMRPDFLKYVADTQFVEMLNRETASQYKMVIYHIGNSEYHMRTILRALQIPGYVIIHDTHLGGLYRNLMQYGAINKSRFDAEEILSKMFKAKKSDYIVSLVNSQKGIITHSEYAKEAVHEVTLKERIRPKIIQNNLPTATYGLDCAGVGIDKIRIGVAGILADIKGLDVFEEVANSPRFENCEFHLFGLATGELKNRLHNLPNVIIAQDPTDFEFQNRMRNLSILINYREQYNGETSLTTIEAMKYGVVVIVRDVGWYSELPDNAVVKIKKREDIEETIAELASNKAKIEQLSLAAKIYISQQCTHRLYSQKIANLIIDGKV